MAGELGETIQIRTGPLLNFHRAAIEMEHPVTGKLFKYATNEHRFQAMKAAYVPEVEGHDGEMIKLHDSIAAAPSARDAKNMGGAVALDTYRWDKVSYQVMLAANMVKFTSWSILRQTLIDTGFATLIEHRRDPIWGDNMDGSGQNLQGKVLMKVRAEVRFRGMMLDPGLYQTVRRICLANELYSSWGFDPVQAIREAEDAIILGGVDSAPAREIIEAVTEARIRT